MKKLINKLMMPFAIIHVRIIQWRYKRITTRNYTNQTNQNLATLQLLQAKEYYYKCSFAPWGRFFLNMGMEFEFLEDNEQKLHSRFINWLFPEKDFKEWDIVIWHNPDGVLYYQNKIFQLTKGKHPIYEIEIKKHIKERNEAIKKLSL